MNVLSLFDGISCGRLALLRAGIPFEKYFASEIDRYAIAIAMRNFSDTIQLGDIRSLSAQFCNVDLLLGGSPCQGFSFAGKQLNFEDSRSKLFFEFSKTLHNLKPKYFLLENVKMKREFQDVISKHLQVEPIQINSSLVSAQNRSRLYWTNIPFVLQPKDKNICIRDIINDGHDWPDEQRNCNIGDIKVIKNIYPKKGQNGNVYSVYGKSKTLSAGIGVVGRGIGSSNAPKISCKNDNGWRRMTVLECERLQTIPDDYTKGTSDTQRYKMLGNAWTVDIIAHILQNIS